MNSSRAVRIAAQAAGLVTLTALSGVAFAADQQVHVSLPGINVDANSNGTTNVNVGGAAIHTTATGATVDMNAGGTNMHVSGSNAGGGSGSVSVSGVQSDADVAGYSQQIVASTPGLTSASASASGVQVSYSQPAKLFGIIPMPLQETVAVSANGSVSTQDPWYSFLYTKDASSAAISAALTQQLQGNAPVGATGSTSMTAMQQAQLLKLVANAVASAQVGAGK